MVSGSRWGRNWHRDGAGTRRRGRLRYGGSWESNQIQGSPTKSDQIRVKKVKWVAWLHGGDGGGVRRIEQNAAPGSDETAAVDALRTRDRPRSGEGCTGSCLIVPNRA